MIYRMLKKPLGVAKIDALFEIELRCNPIDICYVPEVGFIFLTHDTNCLGLLSLKGQVVFPWAGKVDEKGDSGNLFNTPSSLCYSSKDCKVIVIDNNGKRIRSVDITSKYINNLIQGVTIDVLDKFYLKNNTPSTTACDIDEEYNIFWSVKNLNRVFKYAPFKGELELYMGNGRSDFSTSNNLQHSSLKMPNGVRCYSNSLIVCDSGNGCIRLIKGGVSSVVAGSPIRRGDRDGLVDESLLTYPTSPKLNHDTLYFIDNRKLKQLSLSDKRVTTIKTFKKDFFIDTAKDLYVLEEISTTQ